MAVGRQIFELHLLDASIIDTDAALAQVNRNLADDGDVRRAGANLQLARDKLAAVERRQRESEALISDIQARLGPLESRTYDGSVTNPRELEGMQREVNNLKNRLSNAEDDYLAVLDDLDVASQTVTEREEQSAATDTKRQHDVKTLSEEKDKLEFNLLELWEKRDGKASALESAPIGLYESLRESLGGLAVATIGRGMCNNCRLSLPMNVVQKARAGRELSQCPSCTRILWVE